MGIAVIAIVIVMTRRGRDSRAATDNQAGPQDPFRDPEKVYFLRLSNQPSKITDSGTSMSEVRLSILALAIE